MLTHILNASSDMETHIKSGVGIIGTLGAVTLPPLSESAAIFAGLATGVWMITQTVIAIKNNTKKDPQ